MNTPRANELLKEIGRLILIDSAYTTREWQGISVIMTRVPGVTTLDAFYYPAEGKGKSKLPADSRDEIRTAMTDLRVEMAQDGREWVQMLYQIWKPGPDFTAHFEYDDPKRWSFSSTTEDGVISFSEAVRPKAIKP